MTLSGRGNLKKNEFDLILWFQNAGGQGKQPSAINKKYAAVLEGIMPEHELKTIRDIFEKVPTERIADCMDELKRMLIHAKDIAGFTDALLEALEIKKQKNIFPEKIIWKDDGKKEIKTTVSLNETPIFGTKIKLK